MPQRQWISNGRRYVGFNDLTAGAQLVAAVEYGTFSQIWAIDNEEALKELVRFHREQICTQFTNDPPYGRKFKIRVLSQTLDMEIPFDAQTVSRSQSPT